ncbi:hypothetical protein CGI23_23775 [Vibrio parahaemolyticus]|nr:hypothetical protein CGI23_23775 [Vibrio parahaemolyticus]
MFAISKVSILLLTHNAQLSSEQRNTKATALCRKHKTHCKSKLPRVANLLRLFVMRFFGSAKLANENITLNTKNYKCVDNFL